MFDPPAVPRFRRLHVTGRPAVPGYLAKAAYLPGDLSGDGLPGFLLSTRDTAWYYPPEGDGAYGAPAPLPTMPGMADVASPRVSIEDLDGDGGLQLVVQAAPPRATSPGPGLLVTVHAAARVSHRLPGAAR